MGGLVLIDERPDAAAEPGAEGGGCDSAQVARGSGEEDGLVDLVTEELFREFLRTINQRSDCWNIAALKEIPDLGNDLFAFNVKLVETVEQHLGIEYFFAFDHIVEAVDADATGY